MEQYKVIAVSKVILRFTDAEEKVTLAKVPEIGDTIEVRDDEYLVGRVTLDIKGNYIAHIESELKTQKPVRRPINI
ncbi:protein of unknown function [Shewanella benthica]|uniref:Uncharacterized protein n=1 Tax=Shewanella benthica TaxID=43661 RepID=A0A330M5P8_9GAMM|nr:hypothetical protein [Shewanella benthica]SQH75087.1 protein of unknown function [Shewanella benthica]